MSNVRGKYRDKNGLVVKNVLQMKKKRKNIVTDEKTVYICDVKMISICLISKNICYEY